MGLLWHTLFTKLSLNKIEKSNSIYSLGNMYVYLYVYYTSICYVFFYME